MCPTGLCIFETHLKNYNLTTLQANDARVLLGRNPNVTLDKIEFTASVFYPSKILTSHHPTMTLKTVEVLAFQRNPSDTESNAWTQTPKFRVTQNLKESITPSREGNQHVLIQVGDDKPKFNLETLYFQVRFCTKEGDDRVCTQFSRTKATPQPSNFNLDFFDGLVTWHIKWKYYCIYIFF